MDGTDSVEIISQFKSLAERSRELFSGLRDLPRYSQKHWQSYFAKTFDVYAKWWKFQQLHRVVLESDYKLQRWQVGEIASKIGQLYYLYYLHTSEACYLQESLMFYMAVRNRRYFSLPRQELTSELQIKKLRFLARFVVVALLLKEVALVEDIVKELQTEADVLHREFPSINGGEWRLVAKEAVSFVEIDQSILILSDELQPVILHTRLRPTEVPPQPDAKMKLQLREAVIVGCCEKQVKFSELTVDMYLMLQALEWEPASQTKKASSEGSEIPISSSNDGAPVTTSSPSNPHKHVLYRPSFGSICAFLAAAHKDVPSSGVLLLYVSTDSAKPTASEACALYQSAGIATGRPKSLEAESHRKLKACRVSESLYPEDLISFTRKPFFVIIDSENSVSFKDMPRLFGQPCLVLMSPSCLPDKQDKRTGSLFTIFLHDTFFGICRLCGVKRVSENVWKQAQEKTRRIYSDCLQVLNVSCKEIDLCFAQFLSDEFLRVIIIRFFVCWLVLRLYKKTEGTGHLPTSSPEIPLSVLQNKTIARHLLELFAILDERESFYELSELPSFDVR